MPRPKTNPNARSHHKKPVEPALEAMVDTISDDTNPDAPAAPARPQRTQKAGPKKVISETTKMVGEGVSIGVLLATKNADPRKSMTLPEAQSIGHPIVRMLARRVPEWVKPFLPKTKLNPDDAADIEEILATLAKWGMRIGMLIVTDMIEHAEQAQAKRQYERTRGKEVPMPTPGQPDTSPAAVEWAKMAQQSAQAGGFEKVPGEHPQTTAPVVPSNGHNPAFDIFAPDMGVEVV